MKRTLNDEVQIMIKYELQQIPFPTEAEITHIYTDGKVDIHTEKYGEIRYITTHGKNTPSVGDKGILIFLDNDYNKRRLII